MKNSIKREQSQACLNFAERKNFRLQAKHKILMTLALLLTAATGAWAQEADYIIHILFNENYNSDYTQFYCEIRNMTDLEAEVKGTLELSVDGASKGSFPINGEIFMGNIVPGLDAGNHFWSAEFKPEGGGSFKRDGNFTINKATPTIYYDGSNPINLGVGESTELYVYINPSEAGELSYSSSDASVASITKKEYSNNYIIEAKAEGTATMTFSYAGNTNYNAVEDVKITVTVSTPPIDVTINDDKTEASFEMPTSDVTVNYELVRDMSVQMTATMGDGTDGVRYRVKKEDNVFKPADLSPAQVMALFSVNDQIEQKVLTPTTDYIVNIYAIDEEGQPTGNPMTFADFTFEPGIYAVKAVAAEGSPYDGETALSNTFKLFLGYDVVIPAGEYVTYYKDEALYVEDEDAKLYTITSVNGDKANVVQVDVAKANMPILVKNNSADEKKILLIPTSEQTPDEVSAAEEFVGTLTATQIAASDATTERYAFNGKEFVWVKDAIAVGANRAWLEVPTSFAAGAHAIELVFDGETTRILSVENGELKIENYDYIYNLSGQRVSKDYKGVVVVNGKKVIRK